MGGVVPGTAVVCEDDESLAVALSAMLAAHRIRVTALVDRAADLVAVVRKHRPALVVVDAALLATYGVGLLTRLRAHSTATLVALCPPGLELPELRQAADAVVPGDDLGPLRQLLVDLSDEPGDSGTVSTNAAPV
jgi:DNA-binding NtrC family response regulator